AEAQYKRALQLNPNSADSHWAYAHLLSNTGRHAEALAEIKRARELDTLNMIINTSEGLYLLHAGRTDEALATLQKTFELDPNFWLAHVFLSSAYIEKGMYSEAIAEARKAKEHSGSTQPTAFLGYALAKSGKQAEARALLEELLKLSKERYVPPYHIALLYHGLGERDQTLAWLERGFEERDPKLVFLKVEPKWNNLSVDPKFQDLTRDVTNEQMTTPQQSWQRVTELFEQALEHAPEARAKFLDSACAGDGELLREVNSLLAEHDAQASFLEKPAVASLEDATELLSPVSPRKLPEQIGPYRVIKALGMGGMGEVYLTHDERLNRPVAVKLLLGYDSAASDRV